MIELLALQLQGIHYKQHTYIKNIRALFGDFFKSKTLLTPHTYAIVYFLDGKAQKNHILSYNIFLNA